MNILHENKVTGKEKGRKYLVYIIRLEYNLFYLRDLQGSLRGKELELSPKDMSIILMNLLDNAIEAVRKEEEKKKWR